MPGFSEYSRHNSEFNNRLSNREIRQRDLQQRASFVISSLFGDNCYVNYKVRGNNLYFYFQANNKTYKFIMNLDTKERKTVQLKMKKSTYNMYDPVRDMFYVKG